MNAPTHVFELTDSRNRLTDGHRIVRRFPHTWEGFADAWRLVLRAEVRQPEDREDYRGYFTPMEKTRAYIEPAPLDRDMTEARATFNGFWGYYGWDLHSVVLINRVELPDVVVVPADEAAPTCYDGSYP